MSSRRSSGGLLPRRRPTRCKPLCSHVADSYLSQNAKKAKRDKKKERAKLSFALDEEEDEGGTSSAGDKRSREASEGQLAYERSELTRADAAAKKKKLSKNPDVDTSFLPDRVREAQEMEEREELRKVWIEEQGRIKDEDIEITYSYWDGSGHRKVVDVSAALVYPC